MAQTKRIRVLTGQHSNGKPIYTQVSGKTQNDINDAIVRAYIESGRIMEFLSEDIALIPKESDRPHTRFDVYAREWFNIFIKPTVSVGRAKTLNSLVNKCCEAFSSFCIEDISVAKIMEQWGTHYRHNTLDNLRVTLKRIFQSAVQDNLIANNPVADTRIRNTAPHSPDTQCLSVEQVADILHHLPDLQTLQQRLIIALYLFTGVRREELLGLKWGDIDLVKQTLHIQRAVVYYRGLQIKEPKTARSNRYIPLCSELIDLLNRHHCRTGFVISDTGDFPLTEAQYHNEMECIRSQINLYNAHSREFRRTFATLEITAGVPIPVIQAKMGHTKANQTLNAYTKVAHSAWADSRSAISHLLAAQTVTPAAPASVRANCKQNSPSMQQSVQTLSRQNKKMPQTV